MKLNIMFISSNYPPRAGGPATTVPMLAKKLSAANNVSVIAFREEGTKKFEGGEFRLYRSPSFYFLGFSNPFSVAIRTVLISFFSRSVAQKENPSIIHAHDTHISAVAALFVKFTSLKKRVVVIKYAGDLAVEFNGLSGNKVVSIEEMAKNPSFSQKVLLSLQKIIFHLGDYIQAQNEYHKKVLRTIYKIPEKKIVVIPNPVDFSQFKPAKKKARSKFTVLTVSRLVPWKGHETAIRALAIIRKKIPNAELKIIGAGDAKYLQKLKNVAAEIGVNDFVTFFGKGENSKLAKHFYSADVLAQPSLYEPFGITAAEAISTGTPVVASSVGGLPDIIKEGENGYLFRSNDAHDLAEKVLKAEKQFKVRKVDNSSIKQFELGKVVKELNDFYNRAAGR